MRLIGDDAYRRTVVARLRDPVVRAFFTDEFAGWRPRFRAEAAATVQNELGAFLGNAILRAIVEPNRVTAFRTVLSFGDEAEVHQGFASRDDDDQR